jgi:DNA-binding NarL/FixJ family response regulator
MAAGGEAMAAMQHDCDARPIRVLLVDDHRVFRDGLRHDLPADDFEIVADVATGKAAVIEAARHQPDVVMLDVSLPDLSGAIVCAEVLARAPLTTVIVLSAYSDEHTVRSVLDAGARAYLLKDRQDVNLPETILRVLAGESVVDPRAAAVLLRSLSRVEPDVPKLSNQEVRILRLAADGLSNRDIGLRLGLSRHTVKEYLSNAMRKLDVTSRVQAVLEVSKYGLLDSAGVREDARLLERRA